MSSREENGSIIQVIRFAEVASCDPARIPPSPIINKISARALSHAEIASLEIQSSAEEGLPAVHQKIGITRPESRLAHFRTRPLINYANVATNDSIVEFLLFVDDWVAIYLLEGADKPLGYELRDILFDFLPIHDSRNARSVHFPKQLKGSTF
jgi:hypothetical protein